MWHKHISHDENKADPTWFFRYKYSKFWSLKLNYISYHWKVWKHPELNFSEFVISQMTIFIFWWKLSACRPNTSYKLTTNTYISHISPLGSIVQSAAQYNEQWQWTKPIELISKPPIKRHIVGCTQNQISRGDNMRMHPGSICSFYVTKLWNFVPFARLRLETYCVIFCGGLILTDCPGNLAPIWPSQQLVKSAI